jgi:hypothetical protein
MGFIESWLFDDTEREVSSKMVESETSDEDEKVMTKAREKVIQYMMKYCDELYYEDCKIGQETYTKETV